MFKLFKNNSNDSLLHEFHAASRLQFNKLQQVSGLLDRELRPYNQTIVCANRPLPLRQQQL